MVRKRKARPNSLASIVQQSKRADRKGVEPGNGARGVDELKMLDALMSDFSQEIPEHDRRGATKSALDDLNVGGTFKATQSLQSQGAVLEDRPTADADHPVENKVSEKTVTVLKSERTLELTSLASVIKAPVTNAQQTSLSGRGPIEEIYSQSTEESATRMITELQEQIEADERANGILQTLREKRKLCKRGLKLQSEIDH